MEMKQYLLDTFSFNDRANRMILRKIQTVPERTSAVRYFSHIINSQYKWMARIVRDPGVHSMDWWEPVYPEGELEVKWGDSLRIWLEYLGERSEEQMFEEKKYVGPDGGEWAALLKDIALQLNYHSIHHRAQIQSVIRAQGIEPDFIDYIGTVCRKLS